MSDTEKGLTRATGAMHNMIADMARNMEREGRSREYRDAFWENLKNAAHDYSLWGSREEN